MLPQIRSPEGGVAMRVCCLGLLKIVGLIALVGCSVASRPAPAISGDNIPEPVSEAVAEVEARPQAQALREILDAGEMDNETLRAHLREEISTLETDDPLTGWMTLRLAYIDYRVGAYPSARENFRKVGMGEVAAPLETRAEAITRFARIANAPPERAMAMRTWREIDQEARDDFKLRATARHHLASLLMEQNQLLVRTGSMESVRLFVSDSLMILPADMPSIAQRRAAIAATGVETWAKEENWSGYLSAHDAWLDEHAEAASGDDWANLMYSRGLALAGLNRPQDAEKAMLATMALDGDGAEKGRIILWTRQQALRWLAEQATLDEQPDEARVWNSINSLISSAGTIERFRHRAETHDRPQEAAMWKELQETLGAMMD